MTRRPATRAQRLTYLAIAAIIVAELVAACFARTSSTAGHGRVDDGRTITFDGRDLVWSPAAWRGDCRTVAFDVRYADGREPFLSTLRLCRPEHFIVDAAPAGHCGDLTWIVYRSDVHLEQPADVIAQGTGDDCTDTPTA